MANGGGNIWPSATGGGLTAGTRAYYDALVRKKEFDQEQQRIGLASRQVHTMEDAEARANRWDAFQKLLTVAIWAPKDVPISELTGLHELIREGIPEIDLNDPIMKNTVINRQTLDTMISELGMQRLGTLGGPEVNKMIDRHLNLMTSGIGKGSKAIEATELAEMSDAQFYLRSLNAIRQDPKMFRAAVRARFQMEPEVTFMDPRTKELFTFDTATGATLTERLMEHIDLLSFEWQKLSTTEALDIVKELQEQGTRAGIEVGRVPIRNMVMAWNEGEESWNSFLDGLDAQSLKGGKVGADAEAMKKMVRIFAGAVRTAEMTYEEMVADSPISDQLISFMNTLGAIENRLGASDPQRNLEIAEEIYRQDPTQGVKVNTGGWGKPIVEFYSYGAPSVGEGMGGPMRPDATGWTNDVLISEQNKVYNEQLRFKGDINAFLSGKLSEEQIRSRWPNKVQRDFILGLKGKGGTNK